MTYRSMQFMPGNNPGMLLNSDILGADAIIIDLEDAVSVNEKDAARLLVKEFLSQNNKNRKSDVFIRINPLDSPYFYDDLNALCGLDFDGIMLPKSDEESIKALDKYLEENSYTYAIFGLIETAWGLENSLAILGASKRVKGVLLGAEDLTLDLGAKRTKQSDEIQYARARIVAVSKALSIEAIDTPFTDTDDSEGLIIDASKAKSMGMTGKASISPRHLDNINKVFSATESEINHAIRIMEGQKEALARGLGAWSLDGKMVDAPILKRAANLLKSCGRFKEEYHELVK